MTQFKGRSTNSNRIWTSKLRLKPNEVVNHLGSLYQNVTGVNTEPGTSNDWVFSGLSNDDTFVHRSGEEDITGKKNFSGNIELNGSQPEIKILETTNNRFLVLKTKDIGDASLLIQNQEARNLFIIKNNISPGQPQMSIGDTSSIPIESQFYVYGGVNGANIDMRGRDARDECNMDFEGADWATDVPNSLGFSYFGNQYSLGGDVLGYPKNRLAHIRFNQADYAIITSTNDLGIVPIRFGINGVEIANLNDKGIEYESDFSTDNASNPRWIVDKGYVDNEGFKFVEKIEDLPVAVSNVITLADNTAYYFTTALDLLGKRLVGGVNTVILGSSSENVIISSTGLGATALITSNYSLPIRNVTITATKALDLDGDGLTTALDWFGVNFTNCATIGTIKDYTNHVLTDCAFIESGNLTYDGTIGSVAINSSLFNTASGQTAFILPSTLTISRRFRANLSAFIIGSGETGISFDSGVVVPNESYILKDCNFSGGGTYTSGVLYSDNKARFRDNVGIPNSNEISQYYMHGNATATVISATNTPVKVAGTTTNSIYTQRFTHTNNRGTYVGSVTRVFEVSVLLTLSSGNNQKIGSYIAKNGTPLNESEMYVTTSGAGTVENSIVKTNVSLSTNDYIEVFVENVTAIQNITVSELNVLIK